MEPEQGLRSIPETQGEGNERDYEEHEEVKKSDVVSHNGDGIVEISSTNTTNTTDMSVNNPLEEIYSVKTIEVSLPQSEKKEFTDIRKHPSSSTTTDPVATINNPTTTTAELTEHHKTILPIPPPPSPSSSSSRSAPSPILSPQPVPPPLSPTSSSTTTAPATSGTTSIPKTIPPGNSIPPPNKRSFVIHSSSPNVFSTRTNSTSGPEKKTVQPIPTTIQLKTPIPAFLFSLPVRCISFESSTCQPSINGNHNHNHNTNNFFKN